MVRFFAKYKNETKRVKKQPFYKYSMINDSITYIYDVSFK